MNKKISLGLAISLMSIACAVTFILTMAFSLDLFNSKVQSVKEKDEIYKKLDEIDDYVRSNYFGEFNDDEILEALVNGYVGYLGESNATYFSQSEYIRFSNELDGFITGIGITPVNDGGYIKITGVMTNSPAEQSGLTNGEHIVKINNKDVLGIGFRDAVNMLYGDADTTLRLTVRNAGVDREVMVTKRGLNVPSVSSRLINDSIGYIKIYEFNRTTPEQFSSAIEALISQGAKSVVFDVRNCNGILLSSVSDVISQVISAIDYATVTDAKGISTSLSDNNQSEYDLPMAILVNSNTSAEAELFACILRDYSNAVIVGTYTRGIGTISQTFEFLDGSAIRFSTSSVKSKRSSSYDEIGLQPNYEVSISDNSEDYLSSLDETTDPQLKKAVEYLLAAITTH